MGQGTLFILGSLENPYGLPIHINWTFSLGVTAEALRQNIDWKSAFLRGSVSFGQYFR